MLSIIVPVRNESENIEAIFMYFNDNLVNLNFELLIINDFSNDDTLIKAQNLSRKNKNLKVLNGYWINQVWIKITGKTL